MLARREEAQLEKLLRANPVTALLGPRQVGKTTLARRIGDRIAKTSLYLDLERPSDRARLSDPELFLASQAGRLLILDELQRMPELFPVLRGVVDERIRKGERTCQFLVLGSASRDLLQQSSESLAGRIAYLELTPFTIDEIAAGKKRPDLDRLWVRGGFPGSFLAHDEEQSYSWREQFVQTYLTRDLPQLGLRLPAEQVSRLWRMLAHGQGDQLNAARLASSLGVTGNTVRHYLDVLTELFMVRQLQPWSGNSRKRLVKAPKVYVRDSGLMHALASIPDLHALTGHPLCGASWEGFLIENTLASTPSTWRASYYRTSAQAEIDLVLEGPRGRVIAVEIKRTLSPALTKGFYNGFEDIGAKKGFVVIPSGDRYPLAQGVEAISAREFLAELPQLFA